MTIPVYTKYKKIAFSLFIADVCRTSKSFSASVTSQRSNDVVLLAACQLFSVYLLRQRPEVKQNNNKKTVITGFGDRKRHSCDK